MHLVLAVRVVVDPDCAPDASLLDDQHDRVADENAAIGGVSGGICSGSASSVIPRRSPGEPDESQRDQSGEITARIVVRRLAKRLQPPPISHALNPAGTLR